MVDFATFDGLRRIKSQMPLHEQRSVESSASKRQFKDTFLSHSSKDAELLPAVIKLLEDYGASVYCDLDDNRMPENPNPQTAQLIRNQLRSGKKLVVFVTVNSKDSKWVPWELGLGDVSLSPDNVALLPVSSRPSEQSWAKQEYLGLYRHIVYGRIRGDSRDTWMVYDYRQNEAVKLETWFR